MRGHIEKRGRNTWRIRIDLGTGANGKRVRSDHRFRGTKKEAEAELARLVHELNTGAFVEPSKMYVRDYLERWLQDTKPRVAARTHERYEQIVLLHLTPALGHHLLTRLHPLHIETYYREAQEHGRTRPDSRGSGLSAQTVLHHHRVLREALQRAVRLNLLASNPADRVQPPRASRQEMHALDEVGTARLLAAADGTDLYAPVALAVTTGLRRGELLALRWADLDLDARTLTVCRSLEQTKDGLRFKEPKTAKSRRAVALPLLAVEALKAHRKEQAELRLAFGAAYKDQDLVFSMPEGGPWRPMRLTDRFRRLCAKHGVDLTLHELRHSHASQLLKSGIPVKVVSERLGHSTAMLTLNTYSHVLAGQQEEAAAAVDQALGDAIRRAGGNR